MAISRQTQSTFVIRAAGLGDFPILYANSKELEFSQNHEFFENPVIGLIGRLPLANKKLQKLFSGYAYRSTVKIPIKEIENCLVRSESMIITWWQGTAKKRSVLNFERKKLLRLAFYLKKQNPKIPVVDRPAR